MRAKITLIIVTICLLYAFLSNFQSSFIRANSAGEQAEKSEHTTAAASAAAPQNGSFAVVLTYIGNYFEPIKTQSEPAMLVALSVILLFISLWIKSFVSRKPIDSGS
jgi:hypothetical protein